MEYMYLSNVLCEAAKKIQDACGMLLQNGLAGYAEDAAALYGKMFGEAQMAPRRETKGAGLMWREAPLLFPLDTEYKQGNRYYTWQAACEAAVIAGNSWRLPTPEEIKKLYAEDPTNVVFKLNGRCTAEGVSGIRSTAVLWTAQDDSRDFAIECTLSEEFGLTSHPALKANHNTVWLVKEL